VIYLCALFLSTRANAHPEFSPVTTNRYLKLDLVAVDEGGDEVRLAYSVMFGAGPALAERRRADGNRDGKLDDAESRAIGDKLQADVAAHLKILVDGRPAAPNWEPPAVGLAGVEVGPSPFSVDLVARLACPGAGVHLLVLDDNTELPQLGETEIRIEESPRTRLLEAHRGPPQDRVERGDKSGGARDTQILFRGPKFSALEDRSVTVRFEAATATGNADSRAKHLGLVGAAALLLGLTVGWWVRRRYRRATAA
jgi:hypothetical protein